MDYSTMLAFVIMVVVYSVLGYIKSADPKTWDWAKFAATVIVAIVVAIVNFQIDFVPTEEWVVAQMLTFAGAIYALENFLKWLFRNTPAKAIPIKLWK